MVVVAQLVRVAVCGAAGRRFEPGQPPKKQKLRSNSELFFAPNCFFLIQKETADSQIIDVKSILNLRICGLIF
jgi:hypothetical protein